MMMVTMAMPMTMLMMIMMVMMMTVMVMVMVMVMMMMTIMMMMMMIMMMMMMMMMITMNMLYCNMYATLPCQRLEAQEVHGVCRASGPGSKLRGPLPHIQSSTRPHTRSRTALGTMHSPGAPNAIAW